MFWKNQKATEIKNKLEILNKKMSEYVCCFSGHRPYKLPWGYNEKDTKCIEMKKRLYIEIENSIHEGYKIFLCGMALGFDIICAETVLDLKKKYKHIKLIGALPCKNQECKWNLKQQLRYKKLLKRLDGVRCIYNKYNGYKCLLERNEYMINNSSKIIVLYNNKPGGTQNTLNNAIKKGLKVCIIPVE